MPNTSIDTLPSRITGLAQEYRNIIHTDMPSASPIERKAMLEQAEGKLEALSMLLLDHLKAAPGENSSARYSALLRDEESSARDYIRLRNALVTFRNESQGLLHGPE